MSAPAIAAAFHAAVTQLDDAAPADPCAASFSESHWGLRIASVFIILVTSLFGTLLPIFLRNSSFVPRWAFEFAKFFGSGVIIATAFIHLLAPAFQELGSPCLTGAWQEYTFAPAIAMISVLFMFFAEVAAYRLGTKRLLRLGVAYSTHAEDATDAHAHSHRHDPPLDVDTSGPESQAHVHPSISHTHADEHGESAHSHAVALAEKGRKDTESASSHSDLEHAPSSAEATAQLIAVAVLEFGVMLHSIIIGLTLAVSDEFVVLFIVIIFHQMFEGLGLGSRLSALSLPKKFNSSRYVAAIIYAICTPVGIAVGLGIRQTYNGNGVAANIVSGILDAISAGILLYTGLVELLAHEILLNPRMMKSSDGKLTYVFLCICAGAGLMALLGRWA
ncbi:Zinc-regulated transporter 2 [Vanrija pseudolonga]|uniref:Zinc-regulated transporter 2 n=1 Tax=Vanrija pseudolonga TaxID=143232 RepID=A0AAF0YIN3_9TREE|nr:Zinc-regulated transporter 2 [Vanrija pseudolonga]